MTIKCFHRKSNGEFRKTPEYIDSDFTKLDFDNVDYKYLLKYCRFQIVFDDKSVINGGYEIVRPYFDAEIKRRADIKEQEEKAKLIIFEKEVNDKVPKEFASLVVFLKNNMKIDSGIYEGEPWVRVSICGIIISGT